jgi:aspartate-semialdehyde dehydrogenase
VTANEIRELLANSQGIVVMDDPENRIFPTPIDVVDTDPTAVGRIRVSPEYPNEIDFFVCGDNLRKGAALNTAQIAEEVAKEFN